MTQSTWRESTENQVGILHSPPGSVLTVLKDDEVIVWLIGEIDGSLALDLQVIAEEAPRCARSLVLDGSRVTFADSTVLRFIAIAAADMQLTIRRPSPIFSDILAFSGLDPRVSSRSSHGRRQ